MIEKIKNKSITLHLFCNVMSIFFSVCAMISMAYHEGTILLLLFAIAAYCYGLKYKTN